MPLNDTGVLLGGDYPSGNNSNCTSNVVGHQDCHAGRDVTHFDDSDGYAGFSYTKVSITGEFLPAEATTWFCVKDNVTGLIWEVKTDDDSVFDKDNTYRWGGKTHLGENYGTYYSDWDELIDMSNSTERCGGNNWRVPTISELESLVNHGIGYPYIDTRYFPNTIGYYWSATPSAQFSTRAWYLSHYDGHRSINIERNDSRFNNVRLVLDGE
jgi:hypothetical protein